MTDILAYHVSSQERLRVVERNVANDPNRDGLLLGANVASFTTTQYRGGLPTRSVYPRNAAVDTDCYRYVAHFNPNDYYKFKMATSYGQVHYLLLERDNRAERRLARRLRERIPRSENEDWTLYFPNGRANDYTDPVIGRVFVNVMFWHDVTPRNRRGDAVVKRGPVFTYPNVDALDVDEWLATIPRESWSEEEDEEEHDDKGSSSEEEESSSEGSEEEESSEDEDADADAGSGVDDVADLMASASLN